MGREDLLIYLYPVNKLKRSELYDVTMDNLVIGDLHSNAMKLIHILIQNGIADLNPTTLDQKRNIYKSMAAAYLDNDIGVFRDLVRKHLVFNTYIPFIRLIGDTLSDRGINDAFILELYNKMFDSNVDFDVLLSNHDVGFLNMRMHDFAYDKKIPDSNEAIINASGVRPCSSLINMIKTVNEEEKGRLLEIYDTKYLPNLKLIDYQYDPETNTFSMSTHAPFGLTSLRDLAVYLDVKFDLEHADVAAIMTVIDQINARLPELIGAGIIEESSRNHDGKDPLWKSMWQTLGTAYDPDDFRPVHNGINFRYQHGHTTPEFVPPQHIDGVDNIRGKGSNRTLDDQIVMDPGKVPVTLSNGTKRMGKESDLPDHVHRRGINAVFYKRLAADINALQNETNRDAISKLTARIKGRIGMLPQSQQDQYNKQLLALKLDVPTAGRAMLSPASRVEAASNPAPAKAETAPPVPPRSKAMPPPVPPKPDLLREAKTVDKQKEKNISVSGSGKLFDKQAETVRKPGLKRKEPKPTPGTR